MNWKILGPFIAVVVLLLLVPMLPMIKVLVMSGLEGESAPAEKPAPAPPLLNATNLSGTAWEVKTKEMPVAVTINLNPGGQAVATVPPAFAAIAKQMIGTDTLMGTWSVNGAKLIASVTVKDKTQTVDCDIIGDKLYYKDKEIKRVR